jgi:hypothetical protein
MYRPERALRMKVLSHFCLPSLSFFASSEPVMEKLNACFGFIITVVGFASLLRPYFPFFSEQMLVNNKSLDRI